MYNKIIEEQLKKVEYADLSNYDEATNTYIIPKRVDIKLEEDKCYLIRLKPTLFTNETLKINWNQGKVPTQEYLKVDISKKMPKMIKVVGVGYDYDGNQDLSYFWSGWLTLADIDVLQKLD